MFKKFAMLAMFGCITILAACNAKETVLGPAETVEQRTYQAYLVYEGLATLAKTKPGLQVADFAARDAVQELFNVGSGGQDITVVAEKAQVKLRLYALALAGSAGLEVTGMDGRGALLALGGKFPSFGKKVWKIRSEMNRLVEGNSDPTDEAWKTLIAKVDLAHSQIQGTSE